MTDSCPIYGDAAEVQKWLGLSRTTLFRLSKAYNDMPTILLKGKRLYHIKDLALWMERHSED